MRLNSFYRKYIKRIIDIIIAIGSLVVLSPVLLVIICLVRIKLGAPVIFKQPRPGKGEKIFNLYKFRSMTNATGKDGRLLSDAERLTKFGRLLRSSSLDELPELVNIIKGDMSLIGPRPLSIYYLPHYSNKFRKRHEVRPGLTGLAQINGRNNLQWDDRFSLDIQYVENYSFTFDIKIAINTILKILKHSDISVRGTNDLKDFGPYCVLTEEGNGGQLIKEMATYPEIGSYYWLDNEPIGNKEEIIEWLPTVSDGSFTFSGRSAIDIALRDVLNHKQVNRVFVPSYCCISMLQAFIDHGLKILFYDVNYESGHFSYQLPDADQESIVLIMSYFGLETDSVNNIIESMHEKGAVVIEDITHSLLRKDSSSFYSDYVVASIRKWFAIPTGGWIGKRNGRLLEKPYLNGDRAVEEKIDAMHEKYKYLMGEVKTKEHFLEVNANFENDLIHVDRMLKIDALSLQIINALDIEKIISKRRNNVKILVDSLKDLSEIIATPQINFSKDVLLFLPIFIEAGKRDSLRDYLIERGIYCPVHWPEVMGAYNNVRERELSLICDQRYSEEDMMTISEIIHEWYNTTIISKE